MTEQMKQITTEIGSVVIETKEEIKKKQEFVSSGSTIMDLINGGGNPWGRIVNIVGDKSTGKTLLTLEALFLIRKEYKDKVVIYYDDCESGYTFDSKLMYGINNLFDNDQDESSETVEDFEYNLTKMLNELDDDKYLVYVVDSLDGLSSYAEKIRKEKQFKAKQQGKDLVEGTYGMEKQKTMSSLFRTLHKKIKVKNCLLVVVSQTRDRIGVMFGEKQTRTGGKALDFYSAIVNWLAQVDKFEKKGNVIGVRTKIRNKYNKVGKPYRYGFIDILFDYGVDNIMSNINYYYDLLTDTGKLKTKTNKLKWDENWEDDQALRIPKLVKYIEDNNLEEELEKRVIDKWRKIEDEISPKYRKKKY